MRSVDLVLAIDNLPAAEQAAVLAVPLGGELAQAALAEAERQEHAGARVGSLRRFAVSAYHCPGCATRIAAGSSALLFVHLVGCPRYAATLNGSPRP